MSLTLKLYVRELLRESFQSHTFEPALGDPVVNINPNCKHYKSEGEVLGVEDLDGEAGKIIVYQVSNNGGTYSVGDILKKTLDQLAPAKNIRGKN